MKKRKIIRIDLSKMNATQQQKILDTFGEVRKLLAEQGLELIVRAAKNRSRRANLTRDQQ